MDFLKTQFSTPVKLWGCSQSGPHEAVLGVFERDFSFNIDKLMKPTVVFIKDPANTQILFHSNSNFVVVPTPVPLTLFKAHRNLNSTQITYM